MDSYFTLEKTNLYAILLKESSNLSVANDQETMGGTGQYLLQQVQIKIALLHYMKESDLGGIIISDSRGQ